MLRRPGFVQTLCAPVPLDGGGTTVAGMMQGDADSEDHARCSADRNSNDDTELCAICMLPASIGHGADARCAGCSKTLDGLTSGLGLATVSPSVQVALERTLRDALAEASSKVAITGWLGRGERPERSLQANLRTLSAAMLQVTAQGGEDSLELTARDVARAVCLGPALFAAAGALGGSRLSAALSRIVRLALQYCETPGISDTVAASRATAFTAAVKRLRDEVDADTPITLSVLCGAVCAPRVLELGEAALRGEAREMALVCANGTTIHGAGCDCGAVMGGGFL